MKNIFTALIIASVLFAAGCVQERVITEKPPSAVINLTPREARQIILNNDGNDQFAVIDVRTPPEFRAGHIKGAVLIDYSSPDFREKITGLDRDGIYLLYCRSGKRSAAAAAVMRNEGFEKIYNLSGGIISWEKSGYNLTK